jgi:hypothetical protein
LSLCIFGRADIGYLQTIDFRRRLIEDCLLIGLSSQAGDFWRGALKAVWRKCGKPGCACAQPGHLGHGRSTT